MPNDEFDLLLERCCERLSEIDLRVPALESGVPREPAAVYSLTPAAVAPPKPAPPEPPAPKLTAPPEPEPEPARPDPEERAEDEVFPPLRVRPQIPPPPVPPWRAQSVPEPAAESAPAVEAPAVESALGGGRRAAAAAAIVAAGMFGVWLARRPPADLDIEVGNADAMAVRRDRGDLLVAEGKELVDLSRDGRTLERRTLDAPVKSLRWEQGFLWSADGRTASVIERADGGRATVFTLNHVPSALFVRDNYLWTAEKDGHVLHQFQISRSILGAMLQPLDSFELGGLSPETFAIGDAGTLWLVDEPTRRLYRLRLENGSYQRNSSAPLSPFVGPEGKLHSLTIEEGSVWILAQPGHGRAALRRIAISRLDWTPA